MLLGTPGSDYDGGVYHGKVVFPPQYPFKPPSITMCTPSGRFAVNTRLCLSMSDFHPETWNPLWSVASILTGLQSFFYSEEPTSGSVNASPAQRRQLAADSLAHCAASVTFCKVRRLHRECTGVPLLIALLTSPPTSQLFPDVVPQQTALRAERRMQLTPLHAGAAAADGCSGQAAVELQHRAHGAAGQLGGGSPGVEHSAFGALRVGPQHPPGVGGMAATSLTTSLCTLAVVGCVAAVLALPLMFARVTNAPS